MKKATIKDISRVTGLSLGTISKYLNGGSLRESNRKIIKQAIHDLDYSVDEYARGFVSGQTKSIGVLLPEFDNLFYARIASKLEEISRKYGYAVTVRESRRDPQKEKESIGWFITMRVDALVVVPVSSGKAYYEDILKDIPIPVVFLDQYIEGLNCEFVVVDNRQVSRRSVGYLLDCGHREIAIVSAPEGVYTSDERVCGYREAFEERGLVADPSLCYRIEENTDIAYRTIKGILQEKRCTAMFACTFPNTYGMIFAVNELRISVPRQLSLLGFDDMMFTSLFRPKLSIVDQPVNQIAQVCIERIMELIKQHDCDYRVNTLPCNFVVNKTIARKN